MADREGSEDDHRESSDHENGVAQSDAGGSDDERRDPPEDDSATDESAEPDEDTATDGSQGEDAPATLDGGDEAADDAAEESEKTLTEEELEKRPPQDLLANEPGEDWEVDDGSSDGEGGATDGDVSGDGATDGDGASNDGVADGTDTDGADADGDAAADQDTGSQSTSQGFSEREFYQQQGGSADLEGTYDSEPHEAEDDQGDEDGEPDDGKESESPHGPDDERVNAGAVGRGVPPRPDAEESDGGSDAAADADDPDAAGSESGAAPDPARHQKAGRGKAQEPEDVPDAAESEGGVAEAASDAIGDAADAFGGGVGDGATAPDDEEMPLTDHVEEMALRGLAVMLVIVGVGGVTLFYADDMINFLWYSFIGPGLDACFYSVNSPPVCPRQARPRIYQPLALVLARLKMASLVGIVVALPVVVYQTYRFMRPGLYPRERRYYLAAVPTSLVLATVGVAFAHLAVLPALFEYFSRYSEDAADLAFGLSETFNLIVLLLGFFALVFQIPLLVMLAIMMGVTTRQWLADRRLYFWGGFAAVSFLFGPDPTGMAPLIMTATMIVLFDGTLLLLRWTGEGSFVPSAEAAAARRPFAVLVAALAAYVASTGPIPPGYHDQIPSVVTQAIADQGWTALTPVLVAGALIVLFEAGAFLLRRYGHTENALHARLWVSKYRIPVWLLFVVVGYWASPDPLFIRFAEQVALPPAYAIGVGGGLVAAYELAILGLRLRERRKTD